MRRSVLLSLLLLATVIGTSAAQDTFGGTPAAPAPSTRPAPAYPAAPGTGTAPAVDPNDPERKDLGVAATAELHSGAMHGPTPNSIPGGQVITTRGVVALVANQQLRPLMFDILGGPELIPGSIPAVPAHQAGTFSDQTQQEFGQFLAKVTEGNKERPLVFYCLSTQCWMSYNASLRAINMGYSNVLWYRGGIEAWKGAGQKVEQARRQ